MVVLLACCFIGLFLFVGLVNSFQWLKLPGRDGELCTVRIGYLVEHPDRSWMVGMSLMYIV